MSPDKQEKIVEGFTCKCGKPHRYSAYVYAHWYDSLVCECECGRKYGIIQGIASLEREPR